VTIEGKENCDVRSENRRRVDRVGGAETGRYGAEEGSEDDV